MRSRFLLRIAMWTVAALALAGCHRSQPTAANGLTPIRLQLDWYPQPEHGGFFAAQVLGYYKAEGLDVTMLPRPQIGSAAQIVASGNADFGLGSSDSILEWDANGLPLVAVSATMQHDPQAVMVHADSPIHDFKDLEGHTVAADTGSTWLKYVTQRYNLKDVHQIPTTASIANFLADPGYVQQVFVTSEPFFAKQANAAVRTMPISSSGYDPYRVAFTNRDFVVKHPDLVAKFVRASIRGWQAYIADPTATNAALLKLNPALNPAQEAYSAQALREGGFVTGTDPANPQTGRMTAERWQTIYQQLQSLGVLHSSFDPSTAYALNFAQ